MSTRDDVLNAEGVLVVGAGIAGLFCALKLAPRPVTVLSPLPLGTGASSTWAQGGVAAAVGKDDSIDFHARDTDRAGAGIVDAEIARSVAAEAAERIDDLARWGTPFDRADDGSFMLAMEAAHSRKRVVRVSGDRAGREIMAALIAQVCRTPSIHIVEGAIAVKLARAGDCVTGVYVRKPGERYGGTLIRARATVLAAGGLGGLYATTTNPSGIRGHAMGMAAQAGALVADCEFVQFHPTAMAVGKDPAPLATEALRGEGAVLVNDRGERYLQDVHKDAELAPRDIVARANFRQIQAGRRIFLDTRKPLGEKIVSAFPTVANYCREAGIDPVTEMIPVAPAAHFHMGGVKTDAHGRSSISGLWVCGEASCTGLHGANRLASNSLLEAVVFGARIARDISGLDPAGRVLSSENSLEWHGAARQYAERKLLDGDAVKQLRQIMTDYVGVERDAEGLRRALRDIRDLEYIKANDMRSYLNMTTSATLVAAAALQRTESRGGHFRTDYPQKSPAFRDHTLMTLSQALQIRASA